MNLRTPFFTALIYLPALSGISPSQTPAPPAWSFLEDADQDGMTDVNELLLGLDPLNPADGLSDLDGDGLSLAWEFAIGTQASLADTDADGWSDSEEYLTHGTDPRDWLSFPLNSSSPSAIPPVAAPLPAPVAATPPPAPPPPPPSLSNGDFSVQTFSWRSGQTYKDYQGGGFDWGQGTVSGWSAYIGTTVEVWKSGTETFVELDGTSTSHGIKQDITAVVPGHYVLAWKQCGRNNNLAGDNSYKLKIYYTPVASSVPVTISETAEFKAIDKTKWIDKAHGFQVSAAQIAAANGNITVAFIPTGTLNTYGTLIDKVNLVPVEVITDLDNDGKIDSADNPLREAAMANGATDETKDKGTEYIFHNDTLSNGIWDKEDRDPARPVTEINDDDAEEIRVKVGITEGEVWLDHPAIAGFSFYKSRECKPAEKVNLSPTSKFTVSASNPIPDKFFMRADGTLTYPEANPQFEGDLVLKIKVGSNGQEIEALKMKLTVVKQLGAKKYFHTSKDYILERNTRFHIKDAEYEDDRFLWVDSHFRVVSMRESATTLFPIDASRRTGGAQLKGIDSTAAAFPGISVAINGNISYFSDDNYNSTASRLRIPGSENSITDKCHGRMVRFSAFDAAVSSDNTVVTTSPAGSPFAGTDGKFILVNQGNKFELGKGQVPLSPLPKSALGGNSLNYDDPLRDGKPYQIFGRCSLENQTTDNVIVFTATHLQPPSAGFIGKMSKFVEDAKRSGVKALPGGDPGDSEVLILDGGSSVGLGYTNPDDAMTIQIKGGKHTGQSPFYYINTYLLFRCEKAR